MPNIRPSSDLRNSYNEISEFCHKYDEPVYITKSVYPYVAKKYNSTPSRIERCMRTAITHFWESDGRAKFETIAGFPVERKPTNSEFISLSAEYIRLHRDQFYK